MKKSILFLSFCLLAGNSLSAGLSDWTGWAKSVAIQKLAIIKATFGYTKLTNVANSFVAKASGEDVILPDSIPSMELEEECKPVYKIDGESPNYRKNFYTYDLSYNQYVLTLLKDRLDIPKAIKGLFGSILGGEYPYYKYFANAHVKGDPLDIKIQFPGFEPKQPLEIAAEIEEENCLKSPDLDKCHQAITTHDLLIRDLTKYRGYSYESVHPTIRALYEQRKEYGLPSTQFVDGSLDKFVKGKEDKI